MPDLKLIALDAEDLAVLSAHLQDAVFRASEMTYLKAEKRFAALANRFDWEAMAAGGEPLTRRRCGIRLERVLGAKVAGFQPGTSSEAVLSLLSITFEPTEAPAGHVTLTFSGGAAIQLQVECVESELTDLGAAWETKSQPHHGDASPKAGS
jgi:hypothetical protein